MIDREAILKIKNIYNHIADERSREMYINRLLFTLTEDQKYIKNVIVMTNEGKEFCEKIDGSCQKKVIFGAGIWGKQILNTFKGTEFECFVDNKVTGTESIYNDLPVISFQQYISDYKDAMVIIATRLYYSEIYQQLIDNGISEDNIVNAGKMIDDMSKRQYFDIPELKENYIEGQESFVDAGSFDGKTSLLFMKWCGGEYEKIWALEPDKRNMEKCITALSCAGEKCQIIPRGLWNKKTNLSFVSCLNGASQIDKAGKEVIYTDCLDSIIDDRVTFIKMDIEGAEYNAILGAHNTISTYKPKLAISIYHKPEDIWEIPSLILEINPEYKMYLGHYSVAAEETVLYAI